MGKRRRDSGSSEESGGPAEPDSTLHDKGDAMETDTPQNLPASPAEGQPAEQPAKPILKIRLSIAAHSPTEPVPAPAPVEEAADPALDSMGVPGTAELVKTRRRNKSDSGTANGQAEGGEVPAEESPAKADGKRPSKRHKPDPELAAGAAAPAGEKVKTEKGKEKTGAKPQAKEKGGDAKTAFLKLLEDLRGHTAADGRQMIALFEKLPTKKELPDYYAFIEHPMDLKTIEAKVKKDEYPGLAEFKADVELMFKNAKEYNMPGSDIFKDATALLKFFNTQAAAVKIAAPAPPPALKITLKRADSAADTTPVTGDKDKDKAKAKAEEEDKEEKEDRAEKEKSGLLRKKLTEREIGLYFQAIHDDNEEEVKKFLAPPYNVNPPRLFQATLDGSTFKWTAMHAAAFYGAAKAVRALAAAGASVEQQDEWYGGRALAWACFGNNPDVAKMLVEELKADKNAQNTGGQVAWELVVDKTDEKWKGILLDETEWAKQRDEIIAKRPAGEADKPMLFPLPAGPPPPSKSKTLLAEEYVKLTSILKADDVDGLIRFGMERRFDVNHLFTTRELGDPFKWGPLHAACFFGAMKCVKHLLEKGAKVEVQDNGYESRALAWSVYGNNYEIAKLLVEEYKAERDVKNALDKKPIELAENPSDPKWVQLLEEPKGFPKFNIKLTQPKRPDEEGGDMDTGSPAAHSAHPGLLDGFSQARFPMPPAPMNPVKRPVGRPPGSTMQRYPPTGYSSPYGTPGGPMPRPGYGYPPPGYPMPYQGGRPMPGYGQQPRPVAAGPPPPKLTLYVQRAADRAIITSMDVKASNGAWNVKVPTTDVSVALSSVMIPFLAPTYTFTVQLAAADSDTGTREVQVQMNGVGLPAPTVAPSGGRRADNATWKFEVASDTLRDGSNILECIVTEKAEDQRTINSFRADSFMLLAIVSKPNAAG